MLDMLENFVNSMDPYWPYMGLSMIFFVLAFCSAAPFIWIGELLVKIAPRDRYCSALARKEKCERMAAISFCIFLIPAIPVLVVLIPLALIAIVIVAIYSAIAESISDWMWENRHKSMLPNWMANLIYGKKCTEEA